MTFDLSLCLLCKRLIPEPGKGCEAFPEKIPDDIWENRVYHVLPFSGDNGLMFSPVNEHVNVQMIIDAERKRRAENNSSDKSAPFEEVRYTGNEDVDAVLFADSMIDKALTRDRAQDIIEALLRVTIPDSFQALSPSQARIAMEKLVDAMTQAGGWSVSGVVDELRKAFPAVDDFQLRRIVRTESARIATRAHEIEAVENDPPTARYIWIGPKDWRSCAIHKAIMDRQTSEGLPLDELKALIAQVAAEFGRKVQDDWIVHPNQRGRFTRKFSFKR